jgi:hypothetical protein
MNRSRKPIANNWGTWGATGFEPWLTCWLPVPHGVDFVVDIYVFTTIVQMHLTITDKDNHHEHTGYTANFQRNLEH